MDLLITHIIVITVCATGSYLYGEYQGRKLGHQEMVIDMLNRNLVTQNQLNKEYNITK